MRPISSGWRVLVALVVILALSAGMAAAAKAAAKAPAKAAAKAPAKAAAKAPEKGVKCPANTTQLTGCITSIETKKGTMMLDCNGVKHQVVLAKKAKILIDSKPAKPAALAKLQKSNTKITVYGKCGKGVEFIGDKVTASTKPQKPKRA